MKKHTCNDQSKRWKKKKNDNMMHKDSVKLRNRLWRIAAFLGGAHTLSIPTMIAIRSVSYTSMNYRPTAAFSLIVPRHHYNYKRSKTSSSSISLFSSSLSSSSSYTIHESMSDFLDQHGDRYDAYILDQFGVLHNGMTALDGAIETIELLYRRHKKLIILSNTSAPAVNALQKLPKFGFVPHYFTGGAVTSGEEASQFIQTKFGSTSSNTICKVVFLTWDTQQGPDNPRLTASPQAFLDKCGPNIQIAQSIDEAHFILCHGSEVWLQSGGVCSSSKTGTAADDNNNDIQQLKQIPLEYMENENYDIVDTILQQCLERRLPLVCANPDFIVLNPSGDGVSYMPGGIAKRYQQMIAAAKETTSTTSTTMDDDIPCYIFGKPHVEHFNACIAKLGIDLDQKHRVCHVGDSLHHDIAGASAAGISSILITSGIHANDLSTSYGELPTIDQLKNLIQNEGDITPTHIVPAFRL
jgi:ribonucleotide monophosphatase NagD (HAD superfamily)